MSTYWLRGYHATDQEKAASIERDRGFIPSANAHDWLGKGVYFFQDTLGFTRYWATEERHEGKITDPAIFGADISYEGFFDLLEHDSITILKSFFRRLEDIATNPYTKAKARQITNETKWRPRAHPLDCYVINEAAIAAEEAGQPFRAVRAVFFDGDRLHQNSDIFDRQHIQIVVRDSSLIKKWWRIR